MSLGEIAAGARWQDSFRASEKFMEDRRKFVSYRADRSFLFGFIFLLV